VKRRLACSFVREIRWKELERDGSLQPRIFCSIHDTHAAGTELFDDAILRDLLADHGRSALSPRSYSELPGWLGEKVFSRVRMGQ